MSRWMAAPRLAIRSDLTADLRYAWRGLRRTPGFTALATAIMALGIGANTAVFSVVNGVLLKPLPYPGADRIVTISTLTTRTGDRNPLVTIANFRDWRAQSSSFEAMATYRGGDTPVSPGGQAEYGRLSVVDGDFFRVFGVEPVLGRTFTPEETTPGSGQRAAIISHAYWQSRFGGDRRVLEQSLRITVNAWPIVGVMPPGFEFPSRADIWVPETTRSTSRTGHNYFAVARLKQGISIEQAQADLTAVAAALEQQYPDSNKGRGAVLIGLHELLVGDVRVTLYLLWSVVGVVLLIACANTATLLMGRGTARAREVAVRAALGASRRRLVRQLITESLLLAVVAGAAGMLLAVWAVEGLVALTPADVVRVAQTGVDRGVLAFTLVVTLATSVLFGLLPALHASKVDLIDALKQEGGRGGTSGRTIRTRAVLVVSEIALAVVLLTGAGLLMKSLMALHDVDLGFQPANALVMKATGVRPLEETTVYFRDVMARIAALPGVHAVGAAMVPPGDLSNSGSGAYFIDRMPATRDRTRDPFAFYNVIAPGTFAAAGVPLKAGRDFNDSDIAGQPRVAIVNEALVRKSLPGENAIGRTIFCTLDSDAPMTIVGVAGDVRQSNPAIEPLPECYMPYTQHIYNGRTLHVIVRTAGDPMALAAAVRRAATEVSAEVPVSITTLEGMVAKGTENPRFRTLLFALFAGLAVCLAVAGVYGLMAFAVEQRAREIGLRVALGATRTDVLSLILKQSLALAAGGVALGLTGAMAASRLLAPVLFAVQPLDAVVYFAVAVVLAATTLAAGYLPARRAASVDPANVLKTA